MELELLLRLDAVDGLDALHPHGLLHGLDRQDRALAMPVDSETPGSWFPDSASEQVVGSLPLELHCVFDKLL